MRTHILRSLAIFVGFLWRVGLLPPANEVCEGYDFTPVCHSVHRGCLGPGPGGRLVGPVGGVYTQTRGGGWGSGGGMSRHAPWWGDVQAQAQGVQAQPWGGVSQHALRQTPPSRQLLLRAVRILLECIVVHCAIKSWELITRSSSKNINLTCSTWTQWFGCHVGQQEVSRCRTRVQSEESIGHRPSWTQVRESILALKPRVDGRCHQKSKTGVSITP